MKTRPIVDVLFVNQRFYESTGTGEAVLGSLDLCTDLGLTTGIFEGSSLKEAMRQHSPRLVVIGPRREMKGAARVASQHPDVEFAMWTYTNQGIWDSYGESEMLMDWVKAASSLPNCHISSSNERVHATLGHVSGSVLWPTMYNRACLSPRHPTRDVLRLACGGRMDWVKGSQVISLATAALKRVRDVELHVWCRDQGDCNSWLELAGSSLCKHDYVDGPELFCSSLRGADVDVFLQPSLSESYCFAAANALASGIPVAGSESITFLPRAWQVKDPGNASELASVIEKLARLGSIEMLKAQRSFQADCTLRWEQSKKALTSLLGDVSKDPRIVGDVHPHGPEVVCEVLRR